MLILTCTILVIAAAVIAVLVVRNGRLQSQLSEAGSTAQYFEFKYSRECARYDQLAVFTSAQQDQLTSLATVDSCEPAASCCECDGCMGDTGCVDPDAWTNADGHLTDADKRQLAAHDDIPF